MLHRIGQIVTAALTVVAWCAALVFTFVIACIDWLVSKPRARMTDAERRQDDKERWRAGND